MSFSDELHRELIHLKRGRALQDPELARRLGPLLRELSGATGGDSAKIRQRVRGWLAELAEDLPADLRRAAEEALAVANGANSQLTQRVRGYAETMHCSERTARRRVDEAITLLVRAVRDRHDPDAVTDPGSGWRVRTFESLLRLDTPTPELYETRTIVAERELDQIEIKLDLPPTGREPDDPPPLAIDMIYGARLTGVEVHDAGRHYRLTITLPRRLALDEQLRFCLHYRVPAGRRIRDHCAIVPLDPCDQGQIRVRFGAPPVAAWKVSGVPPRQMDRSTTEPGPNRLQPDGACEVAALFRNLRQGHGYGVAWQR